MGKHRLQTRGEKGVRRGKPAILLFLLLFCAAASFFLHGDDPQKSGESGLLQESADTGSFPLGSVSGEPMENLALREDVVVTADSVEAEQFQPEMAADGKDEDSQSRWSSANETGQPSHWLMFSFPEEIQVSFVRICWERLNVEGFVLESSADGENWVTVFETEERPEANEQCIVVKRPAAGRYFRIRTTAVSESEENQYLYYQNVSILEAELYAQVPLSYALKGASVETAEDGSRYLMLPRVPEGVQIEIAGVDYEQVIGKDGTVYPTVEEKEVEVGFRLTKGGISEETPGYLVTVPAAEEYAESEKEESGAETWDSGEETGAASGSAVSRPSVTPQVAEWRPKDGVSGDATFSLQEGSRLLVEEEWLQEEALTAALRTLQKAMEAAGNGSVEILAGSREELRDGDIYLGMASEKLGLLEEGYLCEISGDSVVLRAQEAQGLIWGVHTLCQLLEEETLPCGTIRDYPRYSVRGFSIDVGRKAVSLETLRSMVCALSEHKMNTLGVHLNDNEILSTSGKNGSVAEAFTAYSGFRLESSLKNEEGESITSRDGAFTKEEWKEFTEWAAGLGVEVVPEIDTPAHSLAITKVFPETALANEPENVDQLDLSREETLSLTEKLWKEYLEGEDPVFAEGGTVHIGMDEYYGDAKDYRSYMQRLVRLVTESGRSVRMWGSLTLIEKANQDTVAEGRNAYSLWEEQQTEDLSGAQEAETAGQASLAEIQVQIWSAQWSDPQKTWEAGYTVINSLNSSLYIIPGGGYDFLDLEALADWEPNEYPMGGQTQVLPAWSERVAGAVYCLWNDNIGNLEAGITEEGIYERFSQPLALLSGKLW